MEKKEQKGKLLLIDANSLIHRAYHALPPLTNPSGEPSGALYGLSSVLIKLLKEKEPIYAAAAFDRPEPTFRKEMYEEYKATRKPTPDDLIPQIRGSRELVESFGIEAIEEPGFEADDIVATLAAKFKEEVSEVIVISGDLDLLQLVDKKVIVDVPSRGISETKAYREEEVIERFGIEPKYMADYKGLVGDTSDNIPGVRGIGPKSAEKLITKYGILEEIYKNINKIEEEDKKLAEKLKKNKDQAFLSKKLAIISTDAPVPLILSKYRIIEDEERLISYFKKMGFETLIKRISKEEPKEEIRETGKLF
ncbi:MAG: hypothetical protein COT88_00695 [Candidatus Colwellbacteria bacterium CG10_big_fil_rev_8_21_14_0_10_41_28]|uniref:5'-3' exonuclease domain-containing protein n=1 Tax=Candidatus Colwellbacteria bacterium CG10_big_fil_rev_8_21_14_0_10_41_28 TaxID=1974539 RepID=A0A2H0VHP6_9BACT|nr:MAG: hypothetical protein COT88_00695 [Candidatus Colwellbacteria bacterium CG10_big_fil_rev_8_21_14_0_10_41_28]